MSALKKHIFLLLLLSVIGLSCTKESSCENCSTLSIQLPAFPSCKPLSMLTGKNWKADTILIAPPVTYAQLSSDEQAGYRGSLLWFRGTRILFNTDCKIYQPLSDWDAGYDRWCLTENNKDILILLQAGTIDSMFNFTVDSVRLTFQKKFLPYTLTYILK
jgi:hypothetical protein